MAHSHNFPRLAPLAAAFIALLALAAPRAAADQRVLVIGIDGLRADALELAAAPNLKSLYQNGAGFYARGFSEDLTFSGPNWSSIINGVHWDLHGVDSNDYGGTNFAEYPNFLARLEAALPNVNTARYVTWSEVNHNFSNPNNVDVNYYDERNDAGAASALAAHLQTGDPHAAFLYLGEVDYAGHAVGFVDTPGTYFNAISQADVQVGWVLSSLRSRPGVASGAENWLVIVTSDHGGLPDGSHTGNSLKQREIPFIVSSTSGQGVVTAAPYVAPRNVDVAKTVLTWMNVPPDQWGTLDGHVAGLVPSLGPTAAYGTNLVFNGDGEYDRGFRDYARDQAIAGWNDQSLAAGGAGFRSMTLIQYDSPGGYPTATDPGPVDRGANFFSGAGGLTGSNSRMTQSLDLTPLATDLDLGATSFTLSAWLGGYANQNDREQFKVEFLDEHGAELGESLLGPVTAADRGGATGLLYREAVGLVPAGTRSVLFTLETFYAAGGGTDGYADNLSFILTPPNVPPPDADFDDDGDVDGSDFLAWQRGFGAANPTHVQGDANADQTVDAVDLAIWQEQFGSPAPIIDAVPEPAALALMASLALTSPWHSHRRVRARSRR